MGLDLSLSQENIHTILTALQDKKDNLLIEIDEINIAMEKVASLQYVTIWPLSP